MQGSKDVDRDIREYFPSRRASPVMTERAKRMDQAQLIEPNILRESLVLRWRQQNRLAILPAGLADGIDTIAKYLQFESLPENHNHGNVWLATMVVIEPIVRSEPRLDESLLKQLAALEREIVMEHIWRKDSSIYTLMSDREGSIALGNTLRTMDASLEDNLSVLEFFFRKVLRLSAAILSSTCKSLDFPDAVGQSGWRLMIDLLEDESRLRLFQGRHLLQICICIIYSVGKLFDCDKSFAHIIGKMRDLYPRVISKEAIYRRVPLDDGKTTSDIVQFYNKVFLPASKEQIYSLRPPPSTPNHRGQPFPSTSPTIVMSPRVTLHVSPPASELARREGFCSGQISEITTIGLSQRLRDPLRDSTIARRLEF